MNSKFMMITPVETLWKKKTHSSGTKKSRMDLIPDTISRGTVKATAPSPDGSTKDIFPPPTTIATCCKSMRRLRHHT